MRRARFLLLLFFLQCLAALLYFAVASILIYQVTTPAVQNDADAHDAIKGLLIPAAICAALTVGSVIGAFGLWVAKPFGRWTAFTVNATAFGILLYSAVTERRAELNDWIYTGLFFVLAGLFLLPAAAKAIRESSAD